MEHSSTIQQKYSLTSIDRAGGWLYFTVITHGFTANSYVNEISHQVNWKNIVLPQPFSFARTDSDESWQLGIFVSEKSINSDLIFYQYSPS